MFDDVPAPVWLLIAIVVIAVKPARYVYDYLSTSPSRRDVTQPSVDLSWRNSSHFARQSLLLAACAALAVYIFTPGAAKFAQSDIFLPLMASGMGTWALFTVVTGARSGRIEPMIRGSSIYGRSLQPKRFWASITWNALLGLFSVWFAYSSFQSVDQDRCVDAREVHTPQERLEACNASIAKNDSDPELYLSRGLIQLDAGKFNQAVADFSRAHELKTDDPWPLANRGITYAWLKDRSRAEADFSAVRAIDPSNSVMLRGEALLSLTTGNLKEAVSRLTIVLNQDADDDWALRLRANVYNSLGEREKSRADEARLEKLGPSQKQEN